MSFHITPTAAARDSETKQIDHNDSIRASYMTVEELHDAGAALSRDGADSLPGFMEFDFFERHRENEKEILRVYRTTAVDAENGATITPAAEWLMCSSIS